MRLRNPDTEFGNPLEVFAMLFIIIILAWFLANIPHIKKLHDYNSTYHIPYGLKSPYDETRNK